MCIDGGVRFTKFDVKGDLFVEICHDGEYVTVCGDHWDTFDAIVACQPTGPAKCTLLTSSKLSKCIFANSLLTDSIAVPDSGLQVQGRSITNTTCLGTEEDFSSCEYNITEELCPLAAVRCNSKTKCFLCCEINSFFVVQLVLPVRRAVSGVQRAAVMIHFAFPETEFVMGLKIALKLVQMREPVQVGRL